MIFKTLFIFMAIKNMMPVKTTKTIGAEGVKTCQNKRVLLQMHIQGSTDPSFLWVFLLTKLNMLFAVHASNRSFCLSGTRLIFERNNFTLRSMRQGEVVEVACQFACETCGLVGFHGGMVLSICRLFLSFSIHIDFHHCNSPWPPTLPNENHKIFQYNAQGLPGQ